MKKQKITLPPLNPKEEAVILHKATEAPFSGAYTDCFESGIYLCRQCGTPLYESNAKFHSHCGWASFESHIGNAVECVPDSDGVRTEIICAQCKGHLGHIFKGEGFTPANTRHCVNSLSLYFVKE